MTSSGRYEGKLAGARLESYALDRIESLAGWIQQILDLITCSRTWQRLGVAILGLSIIMNAHADSTPPAERSSDETPSLASGISRFMFRAWDGPALRVWTYVPSSAGADARILFVMHGIERDAKKYLEDWARTAERHGVILVAPEFDERRFPGPEHYNQGGLIDPASGNKRPRGKWAFSVIEPLFEEVRRRSGSSAQTYSIYGHSAGAQFVHRYIMVAEPASLDQAVAANAGWYTGFDPSRAYPKGLNFGKRKTFLPTTSFSKKLTVLLGTEDLDSDDRNLRTDAWARGQGENRFERGRAFYAAARAAASEAKETLAWQLRYAPGVGHENRKIAAYAADILFRQPDTGQPHQIMLSVRLAEGSKVCGDAGTAFAKVQGLTKTGCVFQSGNELGIWSDGRGIVEQSDGFVTLEQPVGLSDDTALPVASGQAFKLALVDAGGKDPRESGALQRKLDTLKDHKMDLVLLVNSPTDGKVKTTDAFTLIHIPRNRVARRDRKTDQMPGDVSVLVVLAPDPAKRKIRVSLYPAIIDGHDAPARPASSDPGRWKPFSDAVRRVLSRTRDKIQFQAGQDDQGDYLAFDIGWPLGD